MSSNDDRFGMPSPEMGFNDWVHALPQWGPRHIWGHTRSITSGVLLNRTVGHDTQRMLLGINESPSEIDGVINTGRVSTLRGKLIIGALATLLTPFYFVFAVLSTVGMEISTRIADFNIVEPKEPAQKKALKEAVKKGQEAREKGVTAADIMAEQIASAATHHHVAHFRTVCAPCTVAERHAITKDALKAAEKVRDANSSSPPDKGLN